MVIFKYGIIAEFLLHNLKPRCICQQKLGTIQIFILPSIMPLMLESCLEAKRMLSCPTGRVFLLLFGHVDLLCIYRKYLPVGYHGRASSIVVSGTPIRRPYGQTVVVEGKYLNTIIYIVLQNPSNSFCCYLRYPSSVWPISPYGL